MEISPLALLYAQHAQMDITLIQVMSVLVLHLYQTIVLMEL